MWAGRTARLVTVPNIKKISVIEPFQNRRTGSMRRPPSLAAALRATCGGVLRLSEKKEIESAPVWLCNAVPPAGSVSRRNNGWGPTELPDERGRYHLHGFTFMHHWLRTRYKVYGEWKIG
jgi:hypothetical protein